MFQMRTLLSQPQHLYHLPGRQGHQAPVLVGVRADGGELIVLRGGARLRATSPQVQLQEACYFPCLLLNYKMFATIPHVQEVTKWIHNSAILERW